MPGTASVVPTDLLTETVSFHLKMLSALVGWGWSPDYIMRTTDGGKSWRDATPASDSVGSVQFVDIYSARRAWVATPVAGKRVLYATDDDGVAMNVGGVSISLQGSFSEDEMINLAKTLAPVAAVEP